ncbi:50S ribosomal protein L19 [Kosmotoga pacifica]|uniref:Large ribosomal subunit protein bL19 n=1 Tax=Kosmotoga pacifica TaxID=1330330 RepID=A0A0G2Z6D9_9BACT|nr:50S ribosomal protein L19 [Kosmotoga pacifica]AKI97117.1 50S ribosomal protein L19 [Kosmotoga pacifica]
MDQYIRAIESEFTKKDLPEIRPGDTVRVYVKVKEGNKERTQAFEGVVIKIRGGGVNKTFTVRRVGAAGVGVERIFPFFSSAVEKITVLRKGKVRRAKLYYIRDIRGKIRIKQRRD